MVGRRSRASIALDISYDPSELLGSAEKSPCCGSATGSTYSVSGTVKMLRHSLTAALRASADCGLKAASTVED